jgi:hypothetical protein
MYLPPYFVVRYPPIVFSSIPSFTQITAKRKLVLYLNFDVLDRLGGGKIF